MRFKLPFFGYKIPTAHVLLNRVSQSLGSTRGSGDENGKDPKFKHFSWRKCNLSSISKQTVPFFRRNFAFHKPHALCISRISPQAGGQPKLGGEKFIRMRDKLEIAFQPFLYLCTSDNLVS